MDRFDRYSMPSVSSWSRRLRNPAASDSRPEQTFYFQRLFAVPLNCNLSFHLRHGRAQRRINQLPSPRPFERLYICVVK